MKKLNINKIFELEVKSHIRSAEIFLRSDVGIFKKFIELIIKTLKKGNKIILFGNGGSASDAQHIAAELVVKYKKKRRSIPAISLSTDTSSLTAIGNDFSFDEIFSRQLESIGNTGDIAIGISTSCKSKNVLNALKLAKKKKIKSVILTKYNYPNKKQIDKITDLVLTVPANETARIQELHILIGHLMCEIIDQVI